MTGRPCYDWSPVGYGSHPIPGDSDEVLRGAREFRATESYLRTAAQALTQLESGDETESKALDALDTDMREIVQVLWGALDRYDRAADALSAYAPALLRAQQDAERALQAAASSRQEYEQNARTANDLLNQARFNFDPDQRRELLEGYYRAKGQAQIANADFLDARGKIEDAVSDAQEAGNRAADAIQTAIANKDINDSLIDKAVERFGQWWGSSGAKEAWGWFKKNVLDNDDFWDKLNIAGLVMTGVAIALAATGVGAPIAAGLFIVARAINVASTARQIYKGVSAATRGDWKGAGLAFLGVGVSIVGGKVAGKLLSKPLRSIRVGSVTKPGLIHHSTDVSAAYKPFGGPTVVRHALEGVGARSLPEAHITDKLVEQALRNPDAAVRVAQAQVATGAGDLGVGLVNLGTDKAAPAIVDAISGSTHPTGGQISVQQASR